MHALDFYSESVLLFGGVALGPLAKFFVLLGGGLAVRYPRFLHDYLRAFSTSSPWLNDDFSAPDHLGVPIKVSGAS